MMKLDKQDNIFILTLNNGTNEINPEWQSRINEALDKIENHSAGEAGLVLTGEEKSFCHGLDLPTLMQLDPQALNTFGVEMAKIYRRLLLLPVPTVAALNGHAFAGGAFLALSTDYRIMREDRGWFCISEIDVGVAFEKPMMDFIRAKLPANTARDATLTGKRYNADEAIAAGIADGKASEAALMESAIALATNLSVKNRELYAKFKHHLYGAVGDAIIA